MGQVDFRTFYGSSKSTMTPCVLVCSRCGKSGCNGNPCVYEAGFARGAASNSVDPKTSYEVKRLEDQTRTLQQTRKKRT